MNSTVHSLECSIHDIVQMYAYTLRMLNEYRVHDDVMIMLYNMSVLCISPNCQNNLHIYGNVCMSCVVSPVVFNVGGCVGWSSHNK